MEFKVLEKNEHIHKYYLEYNENTLKMYPFKFKLYVIYLLNGNNLTVEYVVENIDDKEIIFGIGGHPAFSCNILSNDYYIKFEKVEEKVEVLQLKEGLISNFKVNCNDILEKNQILNLNKYTFINDAIICKNVVSNKVTLNSHSNGNILEFDFTGFPYIAFWSKVGAPFVCIEPWYTTADKYESKNSDFCIKENMIHLDKGKKFNCKYTIKFN